MTDPVTPIPAGGSPPSGARRGGSAAHVTPLTPSTHSESAARGDAAGTAGSQTGAAGIVPAESFSGGPPPAANLPAGSVLRYDAGTPGGEGPLAGEWADEGPPGRPLPLLSAEEALLEAQVSALVAGEMVIESVETGKEARRDGLVIFRGRLLKPSAESFPRWLRELNTRGYTPLLRPDTTADRTPDGLRVLLRIMKGVAKREPPRVAVNIILFVLTVISTLYVGMLVEGSANISSAWDVLNPLNLATGVPFAASVLSILLAHEFGHYFAARYHKVAVTLPYFIPMPFGFGTLGAFIQLREPIADRRKLFDIGVA
ncbi:MAG: hypothetical protein ACRC1H_09900, partial [Caldilineaceae bacterium]